VEIKTLQIHTCLQNETKIEVGNFLEFLVGNFFSLPHVKGDKKIKGEGIFIICKNGANFLEVIEMI